MPGNYSRVFICLKRAETCISHIYVIANPHNQGYFWGRNQLMKAVAQNTLFSILCMAGVFWAAPTQTPLSAKTILYTAPLVNEYLAQPILTQAVNKPAEIQPTPSVVEGTLRLTCW